jgi:uncharacterized OB-fold protein
MRAGTPHLQRCSACGECTILPVVLCRGCGERRLEWEPLDPRGRVYSATVVRRKQEQGGDVTVVLVDLAQGPRLLSRFAGLAGAEVRIGMPVLAQIVEGTDGPLIVVTSDPSA